MKRGVCAGSFDLVTDGHLWVIENGLKLFDELYVGIGVNPDKESKYMFSDEERVRMMKACTEIFDGVKVEFIGKKYLADYARKVDAQYLLRGFRDEDDITQELRLAHFNSKRAPEVITVFLTPPKELAELSSSFVKGLVGYEGWEEEVKKYLPEPSYKMLLEKVKR